MNKKSDNYTLADRIKIYKKKFNKLDKKVKIQLIAIIVLILFIFITAIMALAGKGKNPVSTSDFLGNSISISGSYDSVADKQYEDAYTKALEQYKDVVIQENNVVDKNYFRETLFVGDSNTEGLGAYNHLSLQNVIGSTGMPIQNVISNRCIWFVGYDEPVTMPTAVSMLKPRRIIINFGTNNAGGTDPDDFIYYYEKTLDAIEKAYPYSDIIVASILPVCKVRDYPNIKMQDIDELNLALVEMCRERGIKFLNTAEAFKDPKTGFAKPKYFAKDGLHLTSDGYKALLDYVGSHKYIVPDNRPARGNIPTRREAPYVSSSSCEPSSLMSSSIVSSSSMMSSSIISSSSELMSSSILESSSEGESYSSETSTSVPDISSSENISKPESEVAPTPDSKPESEITPTPDSKPEPEVTTPVDSEPEPEVTQTPEAPESTVTSSSISEKISDAQ